MDAVPTTTGHRDPVCGMNVREDALHRYDHAGEIYRFCFSSVSVIEDALRLGRLSLTSAKS